MPAMPNRRQASASRIWDGSLYIALRLIRVIPASRLPFSAASRIILQDGFEARSVRFPLFLSAKAVVLNKIPSLSGAGMRRRLAGSVFHTSSLAPGGGFTGSVITPRLGRNPVTWNMYMSAPKNSGFPSADRPSSTSRNGPLPTAVSILPPCLCRSQPAPSLAPPAGGAPGYLLSHTEQAARSEIHGGLDSRELFDAAVAEHERSVDVWKRWWAQVGSNHRPLACKASPNRRGTSPDVAWSAR